MLVKRTTMSLRREDGPKPTILVPHGQYCQWPHLILLCFAITSVEVLPTALSFTVLPPLYRSPHAGYSRHLRQVEVDGKHGGLRLSGSSDDIEQLEKIYDLRRFTKPDTVVSTVSSDSRRAATFTVLISACGAILGPFLDSYHSAFGVLQYDHPLLPLGDDLSGFLTTATWVPPLFGLAGFIIGWLYLLLDLYFSDGGGWISVNADVNKLYPDVPKILAGISLFTFQYWLSGFLFLNGANRLTITAIISVIAAGGFVTFDGTVAGLLVSLATAIGGPLIEYGLIHTLVGTGEGYHYTDSGEFGWGFPLWIIPVYFLGGPAVGNLSRGIWNWIGGKNPSTCEVCNDTRAQNCPNCDGKGYYTTNNKSISCKSCRGRGLVICRTCFDRYGDDPYDIENVRRIMSRLPD